LQFIAKPVLNALRAATDCEAPRYGFVIDPAEFGRIGLWKSTSGKATRDAELKCQARSSNDRNCGMKMEPDAG
jgi:hypothetical protein